MSRINLNNYEAFWLDYIEGNLPPEDQAEFLLFASQHPELEIDVDEDLTSITVNDTTELSSEEKKSLKELAELEELVVLDLDHELESNSRLEELKTTHNSSYEQLVADYNKTKLAVPQVDYKEKSNLKQPVVISMYVRIAVAASIIGFIALFLPWDSLNSTNVVAEESTSELPLKDNQLVGFTNDYTAQHKMFDFEPKSNTIHQEETPVFVAEENYGTVDSTSASFNNDQLPVDNNTDLAIDSSDVYPEEDLQIAAEDDSVYTPLPVEEEIIEDVAMNSSTKNLTVPEFLAEKVLNVEKKEEEPLFASIIDQKTNWDMDYQETESTSKKVTQFKLGKFEFYKSAKR